MALTSVSTALVVLGVIVAFFGVFCFATLYVKPSGKNKEQLEQLTPEQIEQGMKKAKQAFMFFIAAGVLILLIGCVLKVFSGHTAGV